MRPGRDGRYFVRPGGEPFFWLGDTQWELFRLFSLEQARQILDSRTGLGFTCLQIMLVGVDPLENIEGQRPWLGDDPRKPNEKYFAHVDRVVDLCRTHEDMVLVVGVYHTVRMKGLVHTGNARPWARWVADRYGGVPGMVWSMYPRAVQEDVPVCRELARGLQEGDGGRHLITAHPDPSPASSSSILHAEPWLAFNSIQTHRHMDLVHAMVTEDYRRQPPKPVVMAEGVYEGSTGHGFEVTPLRLRRQAYYSYLDGGHHSYGHDGFWRVGYPWQQALDPPGARQMGILKEVFLCRHQWWRLVPDQELLAAGGRTDGQELTLAARHPEGRWAIVYTGSPSRFSVAMGRIGAPGGCEAFWVDPRSGQASQRTRCVSSGPQTFSTPDGWEDGLLVLEAIQQ
ncbi:MAG: hypothetical protein AMJ81_13670 [Phycisphaerae bacterium SM23_33]|nr:MAG: hypothetical protein AMJ81_13670 [Phycisphaerae bacterium SM23_33]